MYACTCVLRGVRLRCMGRDKLNGDIRHTGRLGGGAAGSARSEHVRHRIPTLA